MKVIDAWCQYTSDKTLFESDFFDSLKRWNTRSQQDTLKIVPIEQMIGIMDEVNIEKGILCAWRGPQGWLISNDEVIDTINKYPNRFAGLCTVNLYRPMDAVMELRNRIKSGFSGLRILPWLWQIPPNDRRYYPLYSECVQLKVPFCLQVGHTGPLMPSEPGRPIPYLDDVAREFPDLKIVGGHIGYPWTNEMISLATKYPNVYIDTSAYTAKRYPQELVTFISTNGKKKVLFGSNYPMISPKRCLEGLDDLKLTADTKQLFLYDNAVRVFNLSPPKIPSKL